MKKKRTKVKGFLSCLVDFLSELEISFVTKTKTNKTKTESEILLTSNVLKHDENRQRAKKKEKKNFF